MKPFISVVIPVAPERKAEILKSLKNIDFPKKDYEIIVIGGKNPSKNRNEGARNAGGEIIAFLDDDAIVDKNLLKNAKEFFENHNEIEIVGGPQLTPEDDKWFAKATGEVLESYFGTFTMSSRYKKGELNLNADENSLTSANMFIKKSAFKRIGGFDDRLFPGEDPEFFARAKTKGLKIAYSPELIIYHRRRSSLGGFCRQFFSYGKVRLSKERISKGKASFVFFFPALFSLYAILSPFLSLISKYFFAPLAAYFAIAILFSIPKIIKNPAYPLILPFLYFLTHFSYGLGMIYSLLKR